MDADAVEDAAIWLGLLMLLTFPWLWLLAHFLREGWVSPALTAAAKSTIMSRVEPAALGILRCAAALVSIGAALFLLFLLFIIVAGASPPHWVPAIPLLLLLGSARLAAVSRSGAILVSAVGWGLVALQFFSAPAACGQYWLLLIPPTVVTAATRLAWRQLESERPGVWVAQWWQRRPAPYHRAAWKLSVLLVAAGLTTIPWLLPKLQLYGRAIYRGEGADLRGADLRGAPLAYSRLKATNLEGANLEGANLHEVNLQHSNLRGANLSHADLSKANLRGASLRNAILRGARLDHVPLDFADLRGTDFTGARLIYARFGAADLRKARLVRANLRWVLLDGADMREVDLRGADLRHTWFYDADLTHANLTAALYDHSTQWPRGFDSKVHGAIGLIPGADLRGAKLQGAVLWGQDLQGVDLRGADLQGAELGHCNLRSARLDGAWLDRAQYNEFTTWPEGFDPKRHGARFVRYWR
jgi:uncharacterized protein YjbI with pentapeptide repeats